MTTHAHLTSLQRLTADEAPDGSRETLQASLAQTGMVPHLYAAMAHSPGLLGTYRGGYDAFRRGSGFNPVEQEVTFLAISRFHACTYCMAVHSTIADRAKVPTAVTDAIRAGEPIADPRLQALNHFVTAMVENRGQPDQRELDAFLAAGYHEEQVLEVVLAIAVKTISNYTNHLFDNPVDDAFAARAWTPPAE